MRTGYAMIVGAGSGTGALLPSRTPDHLVSQRMPGPLSLICDRPTSLGNFHPIKSGETS